MSRAYGQIQRHLLAILRKHRSGQAGRRGLDTITLASLVYGGPHYRTVRYVDRAQRAGVNRALAGLARDGLVVQLGFGPRPEHAPWWGRARCYWRAA